MRTYVINLKAFLKITVMTAALAAVAMFMLSGQVTAYISDAVSLWLMNKENLIASYPVLSYQKESADSSKNKFLKLILNEELDNPDKVITGGIPVFSGIKEKLSEIYVNVYESNFYYNPSHKKQLDLPDVKLPANIYKALETTTPSIKANGNWLEKRGITVKNNTSYTPDLSALYNESLNFKCKKDDIELLIVHTHGTESYNPTDRSEDTDNNIVRVGKEMAKVFKEKGIGVTHSEIMHDIPRFNSSYGKSLVTIEQEVKNNPKISIVLDVHRDAMITDNGDSYKVVCDYNGEKIAQVMFVVGTDGNGLYHPNWKENLKFAMKLQEAVNKKCPNLARPIDLRNERFNQHTTPGTLIIEVGTNGNTLDEAVKAGTLAASAIAEFINSL